MEGLSRREAQGMRADAAGTRIKLKPKTTSRIDFFNIIAMFFSYISEIGELISEVFSFIVISTG